MATMTTMTHDDDDSPQDFRFFFPTLSGFPIDDDDDGGDDDDDEPWGKIHMAESPQMLLTGR